MIDVEIEKGKYPANEDKIRESVKKVLKGHGKTDALVVVSICSEEEMEALAGEHLGKEDAKGHPVLAFPESEVGGKFKDPRGERYLGEAIAVWQGEKTYSWIAHATAHLIGIHHD